MTHNVFAHIINITSYLYKYDLLSHSKDFDNLCPTKASLIRVFYVERKSVQQFCIHRKSLHNSKYYMPMAIYSIAIQSRKTPVYP